MSGVRFFLSAPIYAFEMQYVDDHIKEGEMFRPYLDCIQDSDELSNLGIENILLERLVRKLWRLQKLQDEKINKLLTERE